MNESFSIFNFSSKAYVLGLVAGIYATAMISAIAFYWFPEPFYFRPWEYFDEIVFHNAEHTGEWRGNSKGNLSRGYLFRYQQSWRTEVSVNADGFRMTPCSLDEYPILVVGASHTFGSGISDHESIAWVLSNETGRAVFNGGRRAFYLPKLLANPALIQTRIIIEFVADDLITPTIFADPLEVEPYSPLRQHDPSWSLLRVPFKRYFIPAKLFRIFRVDTPYFSPASYGYDGAYARGHGAYVVAFSPGDSAISLMNIERRARKIESLGYRYVFVPIPNRSRYYNSYTNAYSQSYHPLIVAGLQQRGVHAISVYDELERRKRDGVHLQTDTHISALGANLIAGKVASYLLESGLLTDIPRHSCALGG
ncbi:MAG: hypothetical protein AAF384_08455 [Pseudomonadota bacterium]